MATDKPETAREKFDRLHGELAALQEEANQHQKKSMELWKEGRGLGGKLILEEGMLKKCKWRFYPPEGDRKQCSIYPLRDDPNQPPDLDLFSELAAVLKPGEKPVDEYGHYSYGPFDGRNTDVRFDDGDLSIQFQDETDAFMFIIEHDLEVELTQIEERVEALVASLASARMALKVFKEKTSAQEKEEEGQED